MIARHSSHLALWILLIGLALPPMAIAADPAPAKKSPASAAEAAKPKEPPAPQAKAIDNDYELYKLLVDTIDQVERNYVTKVDRRELIEAAIRGVIAKLDPYSGYIGPEELGRFRTSVESEFGGIGIQVVDRGRPTADHQPDVRHARLPGGPAGRRSHRGNRRQEHRRSDAR